MHPTPTDHTLTQKKVERAGCRMGWHGQSPRPTGGISRPCVSQRIPGTSLACGHLARLLLSALHRLWHAPSPIAADYSPMLPAPSLLSSIFRPLAPFPCLPAACRRHPPACSRHTGTSLACGLSSPCPVHLARLLLRACVLASRLHPASIRLPLFRGYLCSSSACGIVEVLAGRFPPAS